MHFTQIVAFVPAVVGSASAICADGQISIGAEQVRARVALMAPINKPSAVEPWVTLGPVPRRGQLLATSGPTTAALLHPTPETALAAAATIMVPPCSATGASQTLILQVAGPVNVRLRGNPVSARTGDGTSWTCVGGGGQNCGETPFGVASVWTCCNRD
jgi:hypothetical protein